MDSLLPSPLQRRLSASWDGVNFFVLYTVMSRAQHGRYGECESFSCLCSRAAAFEDLDRYQRSSDRMHWC